jgi:hypothetical protein
MAQEILWPNAATPKRSSDGGCSDQNLALVDLPDFTRAEIGKDSFLKKSIHGPYFVINRSQHHAFTIPVFS